MSIEPAIALTMATIVGASVLTVFLSQLVKPAPPEEKRPTLDDVAEILHANDRLIILGEQQFRRIATLETALIEVWEAKTLEDAQMAVVRVTTVEQRSRIKSLISASGATNGKKP